MTYTITSDCIGCDRCTTACPTGAIQKVGPSQYQIDGDRCTNCLPSYRVPQCWATCPTNAACMARTFLPSSKINYWDRWFATYDQAIAHLHQSHPSDYWGQWFDQYAQRVAKLLHEKADGMGAMA